MIPQKDVGVLFFRHYSLFCLHSGGFFKFLIFSFFYGPLILLRLMLVFCEMNSFIYLYIPQILSRDSYVPSILLGTWGDNPESDINSTLPGAAVWQFIQQKVNDYLQR